MNKKITIIVLLILIVTMFGSFVLYKNNSKSEQIKNPTSIESNTSMLDTISSAWALSAKKYISANYPNHTVVNVSPDPMCTGEDAIDVTLESGADKLALIFLLNGDFAQSEVDKPFSAADDQLSKILKEKYSQYTYGDSYESLTMANGENRYLIDLSKDNGKTTSELILNTKGEVLCQTEAQ